MVAYASNAKQADKVVFVLAQLNASYKISRLRSGYKITSDISQERYGKEFYRLKQEGLI